MSSSTDDIWHTVYEQDCYGLRKANIQIGDVVVDVGAHFGAFSTLAVSLGATVIAFEPNLETMKKLRVTCPTAKLVNAAIVGCSPYRRKLVYCPTGDRAGDTLYLHDGPGVDVDCILLDTILTQPVKFLKLDCEGAEYDILKYSTKLDLVQYIAIEFHSYQNRLGEGLTNLAKAGFIQDQFTTEDEWFWLYRGHHD